jgi:transposase
MTWIPKQLTRKQIEERRLAGGKLLKEGRLSKAQIAHKLGVSRAAVTYWARRKRFGGLRRLQSRKSSGRPPKLTPQQQRILLGYLKRGALRADFPTDRWTLRRIQHVIKKEFDIAYHPNYLSRFLRNLGWTADFRKPLTLLISAHLRALSVSTFGVIVELRCVNAGTDKSIHGGSYAR